MPTVLRACPVQGCSQLTTGGRCAAHRVSRPRPRTATRGYGSAWQRLRLVILKRDPICTLCHRERSVEVDHRVPRSQGGADDERNLCGVCKRCHGRKSVAVDGGFGRPRAPRIAGAPSGMTSLRVKLPITHRRAAS